MLELSSKCLSSNVAAQQKWICQQSQVKLQLSTCWGALSMHMPVQPWVTSSVLATALTGSGKQRFWFKVR